MVSVITAFSFALSSVAPLTANGQQFTGKYDYSKSKAEAQDAAIKSDTIFPTETQKNPETKTIRFIMRTPNNPEEKVQAEFQYDASENKSIALIRNDMEMHLKELRKQVEFIRVFFKLPPEMSAQTVSDHYHSAPESTRNEIRRQYGLKYKSTQKILKEAFMRPMGSSLHSWGAQSILFAVAIGNVMYLQLLSDYASNPIAMEQHLQTLTDPIAHMAFYSFMAANGFTSDMLLKKYAGVNGTKLPVIGDSAAAMRMAIPYLGMSAGMLVSALSAEVLNGLKVCAGGLLRKVNSKYIMKEQDDGLTAQQDPCDAAMAEFFNFNNKIEQYVPLLLSLMTSAGALTLGHVAYHKGKMVLNAKNVSQKIPGKKIFETAKTISKPSLKFIGARLAASVTPVGWIFHGITIKAALGSLAQNTAFIYGDHKLNPFFSQLWAQFWKAGDVKAIDSELKKSYLHNQSTGWDENKLSENPRNMALLLKSFQEQMDAWRMLNHQRFFTGIKYWTQISSSLSRELEASENFYGAFVGEVFNSYKVRQILKTDGSLDEARKKLATHLPFRSFPLYGVKPTGHASCEVDAENCVTEPELNWFSPDEMATYQKNTIHEVVAKFEVFVSKYTKKYPLTTNSLKAIQELIQDLKSIQSHRLGIAIANLNKMISQNTLQDDQALILLNVLRNNLGDPYPIMSEGMGLPYIYMGLFPQFFDGLTEMKRNGYVFKTYPEYLYYQMLCGPDFSNPKSVLDISFGFAPKYHPPSIVNAKNIEVEFSENFLAQYNRGSSMGMISQSIPKRVPLCAPLLKSYIDFEIPFENLYQFKFYASGDKNGQSLMNFLGSKMQPKILGNWSDTSDESMTAVNTWWDAHVKNLFTNLFAKLDEEFQGLLMIMIEGLNSEEFYGMDSKSKFKRTEAGRSLLKSSNQELNVYLTLLGEMEKAQNKDAYQNNKVYIETNKSFIGQMDRVLYKRTDAQGDLIESIRPLFEALKNLKVEGNRVALPMTTDELKKIQQDMSQALLAYLKYLKSLNMNPHHDEIAQISAQGVQKVISNLSAYLLYTQLTNFSALAAYRGMMNDNQHIQDGKQNTRTGPTKASPFGR